jgi:hypothetical protein
MLVNITQGYIFIPQLAANKHLADNRCLILAQGLQVHIHSYQHAINND